MCETTETETNENVSQVPVKHVSQDSVKHSVSRRGKAIVNKPKSQGGNLTPFTSVTSQQAQAAAAKARNLRKKLRAEFLQVAVDAGIGHVFREAIMTGDTDKIAVVEKAMKLVGLDFASSEESVQRTESKIDAKTDNKVVVEVKGLDG